MTTSSTNTTVSIRRCSSPEQPSASLPLLRPRPLSSGRHPAPLRSRRSPRSLWSARSPPRSPWTSRRRWPLRWSSTSPRAPRLRGRRRRTRADGARHARRSRRPVVLAVVRRQLLGAQPRPRRGAVSLGMSLRQAIVADPRRRRDLVPAAGARHARRQVERPADHDRVAGHLRPRGNILPALLAVATRVLWGGVLLWLLATAVAQVLVGAGWMPASAHGLAVGRPGGRFRDRDPHRRVRLRIRRQAPTGAEHPERAAHRRRRRSHAPSTSTSPPL